MVGLDRFELSTSRLSGVRSNRTELQAHIGDRAFSSLHLVKDQSLDPSKLNSDNLLDQALRSTIP